MSLSPARSIFLSGPTNGLPQLNFPAFEAAAEELRSFGLRVESVHEMSTGGYIDAILRTDAVVMLPGWADSPGCAVEALYAEAVGHPVWSLEEMRLSRDAPLVA